MAFATDFAATVQPQVQVRLLHLHTLPSDNCQHYVIGKLMKCFCSSCYLLAVVGVPEEVCLGLQCLLASFFSAPLPVKLPNN